METQFNGSLCLFEIDKIIFLKLDLKMIKEDFLPKRLIDLKLNDKIWIDVSAYTADKSLFVYNPFGTKERYCRAKKLNKNL